MNAMAESTLTAPKEEVKMVLESMTGDKRLIASMMYGAGLRLME